MNHFDKVLIIDDDEITRFLLTAKLENFSFADKYESFENAKEALDFLQDNKDVPQSLPDLIFLDINMPEMNSWQFLESYQSIATDFSKKIHVCILTSSVFEKDIERAQSHDMVDEYLVKPIQQSSLEKLAEKYGSEV